MTTSIGPVRIYMNTSQPLILLAPRRQLIPRGLIKSDEFGFARLEIPQVGTNHVEKYLVNHKLYFKELGGHILVNLTCIRPLFSLPRDYLKDHKCTRLVDLVRVYPHRLSILPHNSNAISDAHKHEYKVLLISSLQ